LVFFYNSVLFSFSRPWIYCCSSGDSDVISIPEFYQLFKWK
jgi:hypothetical protein